MPDDPAARKRAWRDRHPDKQVTPMRKVLMDLITKGAAWRASEVWGLTMGQYTLAGVKKYLTVLVGLGVIVVDQDLVMRAGPKSEAWMSEKPKTYQASNSWRYRIAQEARQNLKKLPHQRSAPRPEIPRDLRDPLFTISEVGKILALKPSDISALVSSGELRALSIGRCQHRIYQSEVCRYIRDRREKMHGQ